MGRRIVAGGKVRGAKEAERLVSAYFYKIWYIFEIISNIFVHWFL